MNLLFLALLAGPAAFAEDDGDEAVEEEAADDEAADDEAANDEAAAREAEMFGAADREADMFGPAPATDDDAADREADMFGPAPAAETPLGGPLLSDRDIDARLDAAAATLEVGGTLYLRFDSAMPDPASIEGESSTGEAEDEGLGTDDIRFTSPNLLDLFVDARPNDRLRAYTRARLQHNPTVQSGDTDPFTGAELEQSSVTLDQLWLKFDVAHRVYLTAGRQRIKWGAGRFWNPTDFMQQSRLDALAYFDERTGVALVKAHVPVGTANLYAIADVEGADTLRAVAGAGRAEVLVGQTEIAASVHSGHDRPLRLGGQISSGVWIFDLKAEAALTRGSTQAFWEPTLAWDGLGDDELLALFTDTDAFVAEYTSTREDAWIPQAVAGVELGLRLNDEDTLYLGGEYFYNDAGYDSAQTYPFLLVDGSFQPFYLGRHYAGAYALLPGPGRGSPWNEMSWVVSALANLSDQTGVVRLDYSVLVHTRLSFNAYVAGYGGEQGGEFFFAPDLSALGVDIDPTRVGAGLGASLSF